MKTLRIIVIAAMLLVATSAAMAQTAEVSYSRDYRWHGFNMFGDEYFHPGVATSVQGIDISAVSHIGEAHDDIEYWDTVLGYKLPFDGINVSAGYGYFILPGMDAQEFSLTAQIPCTISPRYTFAHIELDNADAGHFHVLGVDIALGDPEAVSAVLSADVTYNDGVDPGGGQKIRDWTHATAGLTVNVPVGDKIVFRPAVFYQHTIEEAIEPERDEVWYAVAMQYKF